MKSSRRTSVLAGLGAGLLALSLVAAGTPAPQPARGTATTSLLGADIEVTGLEGVPLIELLDVTTLATTDPGADANPVGGPFAQSGVVPLRIGADAVGASGARSDTDASSTSTQQGYSNPLGVLGVEVAPVTTTASATAQTAVAAVDTAVAEITALLEGLGVDLEATGITSLVDTSTASATQGMTVGALELDLASLGLGADILGQLPLGDLLALLDGLGIGDAGVQALVDELLADLVSFQGGVGDVSGLLASITGQTGQLDAIAGGLGDIQDLDTLLGLLEGLGDPLTLLADLTALLGDPDLGGFLTACELDLTSLDLLGELQRVIDCVEGLLTSEGAALTAAGVPGLDGVLPGDLLDTVLGIVDSLTGGLTGDLGGLGDLVDELTSVLDGLLAQLTTLLGDLTGLLDGAAAADLLSVGAFDVGMVAEATDSVDTSTATVLCSAVDVGVLGQVFSTPDCSDGLGALQGVTAAITDAVATLTGVLNELPLGDVLQVGDLRAELFTDLVESVEKTGDTIVATAGFNLLELEVPSLSLDPSAITGDLIGDLDLPDVGAIIEDLLGSLGTLDAVLGDLDGLVPVPPDLLAELDAVTGLLGGEVSLDGLLATLEGLLGDLDLGSLTAVSTPGLRLTIDPVSTATFTAAAGPDDPGGPGDPPAAPSPPGTPGDLPSTGGGAALLGLVALSGALAMRRRR